MGAFPQALAADANEQQRLAWLDQARQRPANEIVQNLYEIEKIYSTLPDTSLGAVTACPTRTAVKQLLDQHAHCSNPCPNQGCNNQPHCLPRNAAAQQALSGLQTSLTDTKEWKKDSDAHMKVLDGNDADVTAKGKKAALNQFLGKTSEGVMIGALVCRNPQTNQLVTIYASTGSLPKLDDDSHRLATTDGLKLSPNIKADGSYLTLSGNPAPLNVFRGNGPPPGACAAQRMLQEALSQGLEPVSMAESWFGANKDGAQPRVGSHEYASCPTCKAVLATVLCPNR